MTRLRTVSKHPEQLETTPLIAESHHYDDPYFITATTVTLAVS
ncbi:TPA: hypothetical protein ACXN4M_002676 [Proteus mirabilis]